MVSEVGAKPRSSTPFSVGGGTGPSASAPTGPLLPPAISTLDGISTHTSIFLTGDSVHTRESIQQNPPRNVI